MPHDLVWISKRRVSAIKKSKWKPYHPKYVWKCCASIIFFGFLNKSHLTTAPSRCGYDMWTKGYCCHITAITASDQHIRQRLEECDFLKKNDLALQVSSWRISWHIVCNIFTDIFWHSIWQYLAPDWEWNSHVARFGTAMLWISTMDIHHLGPTLYPFS